MAHFLEHLVFKGGEKYPTYRDVNEAAESIGAVLNAYTSHDLVAFHITVRAQRALEAADLLTDFVGRPRIDPEELDRERGVVVQEIAGTRRTVAARGKTRPKHGAPQGAQLSRFTELPANLVARGVFAGRRPRPVATVPGAYGERSDQTPAHAATPGSGRRAPAQAGSGAPPHGAAHHRIPRGVQALRWR